MLRVFTGLIGAILFGMIFTTPAAYAAPTPDSCFAFDSGTGTITDYYNNEANDSGNPACTRDVEIPASIGGVQVVVLGTDAFYENQLTSAIIPSSIATIGNRAFSHNQLTTVTIPGSVTSIGWNAFLDNHLSSVIIHNGVTSIDDAAFLGNQLTSAAVPDSVTYLGTMVFAVQSPWRYDIVGCEGSAPCIWSSDPSEVQRAYESIWYTQLYTENASNPNNLTSSILDENNYLGWDANEDSTNNSLGGHLIDPAKLELKYVDTSNITLRPPQTFTGKLANGAYLHNYNTEEGPVPPILVDAENPTVAEQQALDDMFGVYYRSNQTKTFTAPTIAGYETPAAKTITFDPGENVVTFTYQKKATPTITVNGDKAITKTPTIPSRPTFSGVATPGATIVVTVHSDPVTCTTTADSNGNWSCTLPESLPPGQHTVYAQVTNSDDTIQNLGPYTVMVRDDSPTVLAPDSGVGRSVGVHVWIILAIIGSALLFGSRYLIRR